MLKSVFDNSGSIQGRETANPTCHEAMRVQKNEQVFTNIITKKTTMLLSQALWELFPLIFPTLFFPPPFCTLLSPSFLYFPPPPFPPLHLSFPPPPYPSFFLSLFFLLSLFDLITRDVQLNVDVKFSQVLAIFF